MLRQIRAALNAGNGFRESSLKAIRECPGPALGKAGPWAPGEGAGCGGCDRPSRERALIKLCTEDVPRTGSESESNPLGDAPPVEPPEFGHSEQLPWRAASIQRTSVTGRSRADAPTTRDGLVRLRIPPPVSPRPYAASVIAIAIPPPLHH